MKAILALVSGLLVSTSAFAVVDGDYSCATVDGKTTITYKIASLTVGGVTVPVVEITRTSAADADKPAQSYTSKGVATVFTKANGTETLVLGNSTVELTAGRPSCVK